MPLVTVYSNVERAPEHIVNLLRAATEITARELGKPESVVMGRACLGEAMIMGGSSAPTLLVEIEGLGVDSGVTEELCREFCRLGESELSVDPKRVFVKVLDVPRGQWGTDGRVF